MFNPPLFSMSSIEKIKGVHKADFFLLDTLNPFRKVPSQCVCCGSHVSTPLLFKWNTVGCRSIYSDIKWAHVKRSPVSPMWKQPVWCTDIEQRTINLQQNISKVPWRQALQSKTTTPLLNRRVNENPFPSWPLGPAPRQPSLWAATGGSLKRSPQQNMDEELPRGIPTFRWSVSMERQILDVCIQRVSFTSPPHLHCPAALLPSCTSSSSSATDCNGAYAGSYPSLSSGTRHCWARVRTVHLTHPVCLALFLSFTRHPSSLHPSITASPHAEICGCSVSSSQCHHQDLHANSTKRREESKRKKKEKCM